MQPRENAPAPELAGAASVLIAETPHTRPAGGWRERLAECLERFTDELPADVSVAAGVLYEEWVELALALGHAAITGSCPGVRGGTSDRHVEERWQALLEVGRRGRAEVDDTGRFVALERAPVSVGTLALLEDWLGELAESARTGEDGPVRELGALHETLLGLSFERLRRPARRLRKGRTWLSPADVLAWPANVRGKRLQRELALSKHSVDAFGAGLALAQNEADIERCLSRLFDPRCEARAAGRWVLRSGGARRSSGAHYTPWPLCLELVERTLAPLLARLPEPRSAALLALRVCDPAMGAGAFLIAATRFLGDALAAAWAAEGAAERSLSAARRAVASTVLRGVDKNATAVSVARLCLSSYAGSTTPLPELRRHLRCGDALLGEPVRATGGSPPGLPETERAEALDFCGTFPDVFTRSLPGFDAIVGNPPWVAYVGRAAQPLAPAVFAYHAATNPAFKRYRTLHGLFVYRSAALLRDGGRLGLVLPTSVADLAGYSATRAAHDALCRVDAELPDWADGAFDGVFQPCMALLSTRLASAQAGAASWPLRHDLPAGERQLLERLGRLERLPRDLFGERGFQTTENDQAHLLRYPATPPRGSVPLREGADVGEFRALAPQLFADVERLGARLRPAADWREVKLLIRQTARFPMASLSDGRAFRNSILAGFERPGFPAPLLLGLLNSSLLRWYHYTLQRDARQGMPQLKVGHLRALPAPPTDRPASLAALAALGERLGSTNQGIGPVQREALDTLVSELFGLSAAEREIVARWAAANPPPISRRQEPAAPPPRPAALSVRDV